MPTTDFNDTFLSYEHLVHSFPEHKVVCEEQDPQPPFMYVLWKIFGFDTPSRRYESAEIFEQLAGFRLTFKEFVPQHDVDEEKRDRSVVVRSRRKNHVSLFEHGQYRRNHIRFTPAQVPP